jgi:hypothetical protein
MYEEIKSAERKRLLFGHKKIYKKTYDYSEEDLKSIEENYGFKFPKEVLLALLNLGACEIDEFRLHDPSWIYPFDSGNGKIEGFITFASDINGDYFAFDPSSDSIEQIYFCCHDPVGYCVVSEDFSKFLEAFVKSGFNALSLTENLDLMDC